MNACSFVCIDRGNEYSDEDEENEFSSTEDNYEANDGIGITGYDAKYADTKRDMRKYRKLDRHDTDDAALCSGANPVDSDSEFENLKEKGSRAKSSRVCICAFFKSLVTPNDVSTIHFTATEFQAKNRVPAEAIQSS